MSGTALFGNQSSDEEDEIESHEWICGEVGVVYHLAFLAPGHGDSLWNASRCIAQHLIKDRKRLFGPIVPKSFSWPPSSALEFGAGAALPSLVLIQQGTQKVIMTDRKVNESTFDALNRSIHLNCERWNTNRDEQNIFVEPHTWGKDTELLKTSTATPSVDLLVASDCIYNPEHHKSLLSSASQLLAKDGLFIVGFSLHTNVTTEAVLNFFTLAKKDHAMNVVNEFTQPFSGQAGIGGTDPNRGAVYVKVLSYRS